MDVNNILNCNNCNNAYGECDIHGGEPLEKHFYPIISKFLMNDPAKLFRARQISAQVEEILETQKHNLENYTLFQQSLLKIIAELTQIGNSLKLVNTGIPTVDGGLWLYDNNQPYLIVEHVTWHGSTKAEAEFKNVKINDIDMPSNKEWFDVLWLADLSVNSKGETVHPLTTVKTIMMTTSERSVKHVGVRKSLNELQEAVNNVYGEESFNVIELHNI
jgi:hypothetical protein